MRKVVLNMREQRNYDVIKSVVDHGSNKKRAALELGRSQRTINRMVAGYKEHGKEFFSHKNKGRKPASKLSDEARRKIIELYNTKYYDASFEYFTELLEKEEGIYVSVSTVRNILMGEYIISPKATRKTVKRVKKELKAKLEEPGPKKKKAQFAAKLVDIEDAHPRRPRCANFGEELQMDASEYNWFGNIVTHLHAAIDDATGTVTGAYFDTQETLQGYYNVFRQTLLGPGIPYRFRTDKRTVFEYKQKNSTKAEDDSYTQFAYACEQLGVDIVTTSIPQGKARVERLFQTLQGRLPIRLRLAGVTTIEAANEFLSTCIDEFNSQFALDSNGIPSVFEKQPSKEQINLTLAVLTERTVDAGHSVRFSCKYFKTIGADGNTLFLEKGTKGLVVKAFDGNLFFSVDDVVMALEEIPDRSAFSKEFAAPSAAKETKPRYIPPASHPWRTSTFGKFCLGMQHRKDLPAS